MTTLLRRISLRLSRLPRRSPPLDPRRSPGPGRQRGFALGHALVTTALLGGVGAVGTDWALQQRQAAVLEAQNAIYARLNNGVGAYMTLYYPRLIDRRTYPDSCATASYPVPASPDKACRFSAPFIDAAGASKIHEVGNILQPTLADLQALGLVDPQIPPAPLLPIHAKVVTASGTGGATDKHDNVYGIIVRRTPAGSDVNLDSLVFNVQPYALVHADMSALLRMSNGAGATSGVPDRDTTTSSINPNFDLKAYGGAWTVPNPVQETVKDIGTRGMHGIMAWRNGYEAAAALELFRRDGSLKPTADWDFANHSITNLNELKAKNVATDTLTTQTLTTHGAVHINGTLEVKDTLSALGDLVVKGATDLQSLVVRGPASFLGPVTMEKSLAVSGELNASGGMRTSNINVENGAQLSGSGSRFLANGGFVAQGGSCAQNLALAQDNSGRLMMCASGSWQPATNNVYGLLQVNAGDSCSPEGAAAYLPNGLMAICKAGTWQPATLGTQVSGQACSAAGMMAAEITAQGVANLLVCQASGGGGLTWSPSIYARPKMETAREGANCELDQINAMARNSDSPQSGVLMCTLNTSGGAQWQVPFKTFKEDSIDTNEYLAVDFGWKDWHRNVLGSWWWGQTIIGPITLNHWKNGVVIKSWNNSTSMLGDDNGLYVKSAAAGGRYPNDNYSFAEFNFAYKTPMNPDEWTTPVFRRPTSACTNCYTEDDLPWGTDAGPNRRSIRFTPYYLQFSFYNEYGSDNGTVHYYQLVMFKKKRHTYLTTE
ncbi:MAG TPA: polymer-forming cytoskeletal protein [Herbaspirillum sp.]|uniref:polymer-forming cytoskeletal protein n=1 Tax=Herbaspirillum sp. TaxID=1890675 RepID=UPI002D47CF40|nr:polymer-forming cytoskeletal protein [Herbaspirillum sp.]HZG22717.1 polymer-forming cytoskeletal protein [Herbaspirillum sp.]